MILDRELEMFIEGRLSEVAKYYGNSKFQSTLPYLEIITSTEIYAYDDEFDLTQTAKSDDDELKGWYESMDNTLTIVIDNIKDMEDLVRTIVHEYQHYLQSPLWMKRYYTMGYDYSDHPYEVAAYAEEDNYKIFM
mgnify:CR=1 FL=1|jgi:hypothetical protein|tara:strand:- start:45 stop:449 length:405 start_codon:yes stop_codon:yes gene_type:complete